jgi:Fe-S cluster biogenesis protein NfuA/nitrite reductase/ring-hydroxylating ferredoxin subunit
LEDQEAHERVARVEALLDEVEALADPAAKEKALEIVQALLDLYGEGLGRLVTVLAERDNGELAEAVAADELVSHLLLLHGLHPVPLETRVHGALEEVRPYLESHGGNVELLGVDDGIARLRLEGSCSGCPSSTVTLKLAIENAIHKAAPDVIEIAAEGAVESAPAPQLIQLEVPGSSGPSAAQSELGENGSWSMAGGMPELSGPGNAPLLKEVAGEPLMFLELNGAFYAYRPRCPGCEGSLAGAVVTGTELTCAECGNRYDVLRAGRCLDAPQLHLEPVPLLVDDAGLVKVALGATA